MKLKFTKLHIVLEIISLAVLVGMIVHIILLWQGAPDTVAMHYGADGTADRMDSKGSMVFLPIMAAIIYGGITLVEFFPTAWNVPAVPEGKKTKMYSATRTMVILLKVEVVAAFWYIAGMMLTGKNLGGAFLPIELGLVFGTLVLYLVYVNRLKKREE
ncbi:DUF1648 domain-containing protein [Christensenellaceae bacterium OttesenSCG-928-K19]|nr:DUF1648 domain-containing protein [Christensenellaceae bacterium OttesenSCG-928-K19]